MFRKRVESEYILPSHIFMKLTVGWQALRPISPFQFYYYKCDVKSQLCFVTLHLNQTDSSVRVILGWNKKQNRSNFMLMLSKACLHEPISHEHLVVPPKQREFWRKDACRPPAGTCKLAPALRGPEHLQIVCLPNAFLISISGWSHHTIPCALPQRGHALRNTEATNSALRYTTGVVFHWPRSRVVCGDADGLNGDHTPKYVGLHIPCILIAFPTIWITLF